MLLLPLAENSVKHGPAAGHRGLIRVEARVEGEAVRFSVENPGPYKGPRPGSDGLPNLGKRLALAYGPAATLEARDVGGRTRVELSLPRAGPPPGAAA
jgi:LytS/YehU family sensor histidine kinase